MKKRAAALGMALLLAVSASFPAQAIWVNVGSSEEKIWRHADSNGNYEKNVLRLSNGLWFWIGSDGYLDTGHAGKEISIHVNGVKYIITLDDRGMALDDCRDEAGNPHKLYELLGTGVSNYVSNSTKANCWWQDKGSVSAWKYNDENKTPVEQGLYKIDGQFYYFDKDGEMKSNEFGDFIDGYYRESMDYTIPVNHWIPYEGKWFYCGEDGKPVTGEQTIDGQTYDFGTDGFLSEDVISFPAVTSVKLGESPKEAVVGDVVEIPFTIMVKEKVQTASSSNAEYEIKEADYDMFKSVYAVGNKNRFNIRRGVSSDPVTVTSMNHGEMRYQYEIDWDNQVIRIPMIDVGLVYGTLRINTEKQKAILDRTGFQIKVSYPEIGGEEQISGVFNRIEEGDLNTVEAVDTLKCIDNEVLASTMMDNSDIMAQMKALDFLVSEDQNISTYVEVKDEVKEQLDVSAVKAVGLGFSGEANKKIGLHVAASTETMPEDLKSKNTAAFDLKVMLAGKEKNNLDIPLIITVPKPKTITSSSFDLYHIHDGETEEVSYLYDSEGEAVTFAADSFSTYVFTEEKSGSHTNGSSSSGSSRSDDGDSSYSTASAAKKEAGSWKTDEKGWWFKNPDGSYPVNIWQFLSYQQKAAWYHFDGEGYMQTGWLKDVDGRWYYLNPMADGTCGSMVTGWKYIDGYWYYFDEQSSEYLGALVMNGVTPDGYTVDALGRWIQ